jgi:transglutaminase-like putative cysteine protease
MTVTAGATTGPGLLDHRALDLEGAARVTYRLEQTFRYDYAEPVTSVRQRLVIVPPARHGDATLVHHSLDVLGAASRKTIRHHGGSSDSSSVVRVSADRVEEFIEFRLTAHVERAGDRRLAELPSKALRDVRWRQLTRLTTPDAALRDWAAELHHDGERPEDTAQRICSAVHARMTYEFGITGTSTTAAQALAGGRGVCQDYAHIALALCHELGLPARYVSGHLLGQGGTHAWFEVLVDAGDRVVAIPFDPCNDRRAGRGYLTIATGRDYADVAPTAGTYEGALSGQLSSTRRLGVVSVA